MKISDTRACFFTQQPLSGCRRWLKQPPPPKPRIKRFVNNQIPDSILNDAALNAAISLHPTTTSRSTKSYGACAPRTPLASLSSSPRDFSSSHASSPTSSPPSPPSRTASTSATSPSARVASATCRRVRSTCTSSCT